eukprot:COSAG02_NODE_19974_length_854_cov_1.639735_1_plen_284_part_11
MWEMPSSLPAINGPSGAEPAGDEPWDMRSWMRESADAEPESESPDGPRTALSATSAATAATASGADAEDDSMVPAGAHAQSATRSLPGHRQSEIGAAVEAASTAGGHGMEQAIRTISAEQERCRKELVELRIKLEASVLAGQVPEHLAAAVAEAVNGQESILRMLCLQGEAQQARLALPGEVVVEGKGVSRGLGGGGGGGASLVSVSKSVADLSHQFRSLQNELLNGGGPNRRRRGRRGSKIRNAFEQCAGRVRSARRPTGVTEMPSSASKAKLDVKPKRQAAP